MLPLGICIAKISNPYLRYSFCFTKMTKKQCLAYQLRYWWKNWCPTSEYPVGNLVPDPSFLPMQIPRGNGDHSSYGFLPPIWKTEIMFLASGFCPKPASAFRSFGGINQWIGAYSFFLSLCLSDKNLN